MTYSPTAAVGLYCATADLLGVPEPHVRCRGTGPMYLPGTPAGCAPVLPEEECGCPCHAATTKPSEGMDDDA